MVALGLGVCRLAGRYLELNGNEERTPTPTTVPDSDVTPSAAPTAAATPSPTPFDVKGAYVGHMSRGSSVYENITWIAEGTELNAVVIDVRDDFGYITYDMDCEAVHELGIIAPKNGPYYIEDMKELLDALHSRDIYCIARIVCFRESYFTDSPIAEKRPEWLVKNRDGGVFRDNTRLGGESKPYAWINFYNRDALGFIVDIAKQAALDGFDEICFDYMRTPTGVDPKTLDYGIESDTVSYCEQVTEFIKYACETLKPLGVCVSGSVYGITINSDLDSRNLGQDYKELSKYLDYICPMIYPSHYGTDFAGIENVGDHPYELVDYELKLSERKLCQTRDTWEGQVAECRPWLQAFNYDYWQVQLQTDACRERGIDTWLFWNSAGRYDQEYFLTNEEATERKMQQNKE